MLYYKNFRNYDEFKQLFGIVEHGNGNKSRRNKILLGCLKDKEYFHIMARATSGTNPYMARRAANFFGLRSMDGLKDYAKSELNEYRPDAHVFALVGWDLYSSKYDLDHQQGVCLDGDTKAVRYVSAKNGRVYKMKAGRLLTAIIDEWPTTRAFPEQLKRWLGEEFAREWSAYATGMLSTLKGYTLHVDKDFAKIYDAGGDCKGDFGSCMAGGYQYSFYEDSVDASAAYLEDSYGRVVARCILYNDVKDEDGNHYRLAERQYSSDGDNVLKQLLVNKLVEGGHIDGYKKVGVDCHANDAFVSNDGEDWSEKDFRIRNSIRNGDTLSYQDSFVYLDMSEGVAYNHPGRNYEMLDKTDENFFSEDAPYDDYNEEYFCEDAVETFISGTSVNYYEYITNREHPGFEENFEWSDHYGAYIPADEADWSENDGDWFFANEVVRLANDTTALINDCIYWGYEYYLESECSDVITGYYRMDGALIPMHELVPVEEERVKCADVNGYVLKKAAHYSELLEEYYLDPLELKKTEEAYRVRHAAAEVVA